VTLVNIFFYVLGCLIGTTVIVAWFHTTFPVHIWKTAVKVTPWLDSEVTEDIYTWEDWSNHMLVKHPFFGELLSCPICLSFWVSGAVASILTLINGLDGLFILSCIFSWPVIIYTSYKSLT
jgi:hypothetical protein